MKIVGKVDSQVYGTAAPSLTIEIISSFTHLYIFLCQQ